MSVVITSENSSRPSFVGVVSGVDLSKPLDQEVVRAIDRAMDQYAVLVFRDQPLTG